MAGSRARGLGYGSLGGSPLREESRAPTSAPPEGRQQPHWSWLRVGIASIAVIASLGLLSASRLTSSSSALDSTATNNPALAEGTAKGDPPQVVGTGASAVGSGGEDDLTFVASNEYTRRGDIVGRGYPWLQVCIDY